MLLKKFYLPIGLCVLAVLAIGFLSLRSEVPDEPIVIYKPVTPIKQSVAPTAEVPTAEVSMTREMIEDTPASTTEVSEVPTLIQTQNYLYV